MERSIHPNAWREPAPGFSLGELPWGDPRLSLAIGAADVALTFEAVDVLAVVAVLVSGYKTFSGLAKKERSGGNHETAFVENEEIPDPSGFDNIANLNDEYNLLKCRTALDSPELAQQIYQR